MKIKFDNFYKKGFCTWKKSWKNSKDELVSSCSNDIKYEIKIHYFLFISFEFRRQIL